MRVEVHGGGVKGGALWWSMFLGVGGMTGVRVLGGRWYMGMADRVDEQTGTK